MPTVLMTHPAHVLGNYFTESALHDLRGLTEVRLNDSGHFYSTEEMVEAARRCEIVVTNPQQNTEAAFFEQASDLVAYVRCGNDLTNVAVDAASANGVLVAHARPSFVPSVVELIIGFMIDLGRTVTSSTIIYRNEKIQPPVTIGRQLNGSTLGVIGYGAIGRYLCELGLTFGMRVLVCDPYVDYTRPGIQEVDLARLLAESDFVVCLAKSTAETENLMNGAVFAAMKPSAFFVNASRGALVDEEALKQALDEGQIAGAALDVGRQPGNMPTVGLASRDDVIATPHLGGRTPPSIIEPADESVGQVAIILKGEVPRGSVNAGFASRLERLRH